MLPLRHIAAAAALLACAAESSAAEEMRIVTWNVRDAFAVEDVETRVSDFKNAADALRPDILLVQEVTSPAVIESIRDAMGLSGFTVTVSDFVQADNPTRNSFEVGIVSAAAPDAVVEYDPTPDNRSGEGDPAEGDIEPVVHGIVDVGTSPGFVWARFDELKLTVSVVHLKSSVGRVGQSDKSNAEKRELVAGALADWLHHVGLALPDYAHLVGGDFNVGHSDGDKNGIDLAEDCFSECEGDDRYDETHALLAGGLIHGLEMVNLAAGIPDTTFPGFPGSPVDNLYVAPAGAAHFTAAEKTSDTFGSDHLAVGTTYTAP